MELETLIDRIAPKLRAIASGLNRRSAYFDADDLYQEALLFLTEEARTGRLDDKTDSYILQGCMFFLKNRIRCSFRSLDAASVRFGDLSPDGKRVPEEVISCPGNDTRFACMMVEIAVGELRGRLTPREDEIMTLSLVEMTTREIGARLGISHPMVVKVEKRIREKARGLMKKKILIAGLPE